MQWRTLMHKRPAAKIVHYGSHVHTADRLAYKCYAITYLQFSTFSNIPSWASLPGNRFAIHISVIRASNYGNTFSFVLFLVG